MGSVNKPEGYDDISARTEFESLPPGGYVCKVLNVEDGYSKKGNPMITVAFDIAEGQFKDYFTNLYNARVNASNTPDKVHFPYDAYAYIPIEINGEPNSAFKGFNTSIEESGGQIMWGEQYCNSINGSLIGVLFGREESESNGNTYWNTKPFYYRSVETIREGKFSVPQDRPLKPKNEMQMPVGFQEVKDNKIPF